MLRLRDIPCQEIVPKGTAGKERTESP